IIKNMGISGMLPVGHGPALNHPDAPYYEEWCFEYLDKRGKQTFKNTENFLTAADTILRVMRLYKEHRDNSVLLENDLPEILANYDGLNEMQRKALTKLFVEIDDDDDGARHTKWGLWATSGQIPGVNSIPEYNAKGKKSWKYLALGTIDEVDDPNKLFTYDPSFLTSEWKKFHDALQEQRQYILLELLPSYGICVC
ncbi:MAG TPA: DUF6765 family protein, partial [Desulfosporosinus sp.]|nr:DUF6765 family protein [Desulfosporosinus sp.]